MKKKLLLSFTALFLGIFALCGASVSADDAVLTYDVDNLSTDLDHPDYRAYVQHCNKDATEVVIPRSVYIDGYGSCTVYRIGSAAFANCTSLKSVTLQDGLFNYLTAIEGNAFYGCTALESITIPDDVTHIGDGVFYGCTALKSITLPDSVVRIGSNAFYGCNNLSNVYITDIAAYLNCNYINERSIPTYYANRLYLNGKRVTSLTIPDTVKKIPYYTFYNCESLKSITIPSSVTSIGDYAFSGSGIKSITIPSSVTEIGEKLFQDCSQLTTVVLPNNITSIGKSMFWGCSSLENITIPDSVTSIGSWAFAYCKSLESITIPGDVTSINAGTFFDCYKLSSVTLPNSVTSIGDEVFVNCYSLRNITLPAGLKKIDSSFSNSSLQSIALPEGFTTLDSNAFSGCEKLELVVLPKSLIEIEAASFRNCDNLSAILYAGSEDEWNEIFISQNENEALSNAKITFNAQKKTYKLVTGTDEELDDITDYALYAPPLTKSSGKYLVGWYDNAECSGSPITFPYYGDKTTLYAAWRNESGLSFDDPIKLEVGGKYPTYCAYAGQSFYFEFTPNISGEYSFISSKNRTYSLYDSNRFAIDEMDSSTFSPRKYYELTAGEKYYIKLTQSMHFYEFDNTLECDAEYLFTPKLGFASYTKDSVTLVVDDGEYAPSGAKVSVACYKDGRMTKILSAESKSENIFFIFPRDFDTAKLMVWSSSDSMEPVFEVQTRELPEIIS